MHRLTAYATTEAQKPTVSYATRQAPGISSKVSNGSGSLRDRKGVKRKGMMAFGRKPTNHHASDCIFGSSY